MVGISYTYANYYIELRTYINGVWDIAQSVCYKKRK